MHTCIFARGLKNLKLHYSRKCHARLQLVKRRLTCEQDEAIPRMTGGALMHTRKRASQAQVEAFCGSRAGDTFTEFDGVLTAKLSGYLQAIITHINAMQFCPNGRALSTNSHEVMYRLLDIYAHFAVNIRASDQAVFNITRWTRSGARSHRYHPRYRDPGTTDPESTVQSRS